MIEAFETALSELHEIGSEKHGDQWMGLVRSRIGELEEAYKNLYKEDRDPIDYSDLPTQAAYVFAYAMPRAAFTYEFLKRHREALGKPLFDDERIAVVSFGGGPASELVGLLQYLDDEDMGESVTSLAYRVIDKDGEWDSIAESISDAIETDININIKYIEADLSKAKRTDKISLKGADLIIFSYVMSELSKVADRDKISENMRKIIGTMDSESSILFMDNKYPIFINYFKTCKSYVKGLREKNDDGNELDLDLPELTATFDIYARTLNRTPRMSGTAVSKYLKRD